jgi:hypothetical protein
VPILILIFLPPCGPVWGAGDGAAGLSRDACFGAGGSVGAWRAKTSSAPFANAARTWRRRAVERFVSNPLLFIPLAHGKAFDEFCADLGGLEWMENSVQSWHHRLLPRVFSPATQKKSASQMRGEHGVLMGQKRTGHSPKRGASYQNQKRADFGK